jgi:hypothetical protein
MKSPLDQIEGKIKALFEGSSSLFPWMDEQSTLMHRLIESIQECFADFDTDLTGVPIRFSFYMNPEDRQFLEQQTNWQTALSKFITEISAELGYTLETQPEIQVISKLSLTSGDVEVKTFFEQRINRQTSAVPIALGRFPGTQDTPAHTASLILEDENLFPLDRSVINIGRKSSNHLVINDLRVSRTHAQIRAVPDGFIIFDIGSSGGTYINGERIYQHKLKPGDVISLAGIKLIYTEDQTSSIEEARQVTSEIKPLSSAGNEPC